MIEVQERSSARDFGPTYSRRELLKKAASIGAIPLAASIPISQDVTQQRKEEFEKSFTGFTELKKHELGELILNYAETTVLDGTINDITSPNTFEFEIPEKSPVFVTIKGGTFETAFVQPLLIDNQQERTYLAPVVHAPEEYKSMFTGVNIGVHDKGKHTITVSQDVSSSFKINEPLDIFVSVPKSDSSLLAKFIVNSPVLQIKDPGNVLDDIPFYTFSKILRKDELYQVFTVMVFSSENGGTMPPQLLLDTDRTIDIEWVMQQLYTVKGELLYNNLRYQTVSHGEDSFDGRYLDERQPILYNVTPNNNFSDSDNEYSLFGEKAIKNPLKKYYDALFGGDEGRQIYYSPKSVFVPGDYWGAELLDEYPQLQEWSLFEVALEKCVNLDDVQNPNVRMFREKLGIVTNNITRIYPDRGCGDKRIDIASEESLSS